MRRAEEEDDKEDKSPRPDPQSLEIAKALYKSRTVLVFGEVDMKMAERVTAQLLAYAESEGDIRVIVNSPGGTAPARAFPAKRTKPGLGVGLRG